MKLFLGTVDQGTIAGAAAENAIAPSAVSRRLAELEAHLGTTLLLRERRGVTPTGAGKTLARHARNVFRLLDRMEAEMSEFSDGARGHVRVVANTSAITQFLPGDLSAFKTMYPDVRIALGELTSELAVQDVSKGLADIAVFSEAVSPADLEVFPYRQDRLVVIAPPGHPLAEEKNIRFEETLEYQHVGLQPGSSLLAQLETCAAQLGHSISFAVQVTSFDGVRRMVESGLGIAVLPDGAVVPTVNDARLHIIPLSDSWAKRNLLIGVREVAALPVAARNLLSNLTQGPERSQSGEGTQT